LIAPDEGGANHFIVAIEQDGAMHLSGKSDAGDLIVAGFGRSESAPDGQRAGSPPVARVLLRPPGLRRCEGSMLFRGGGDHASLLVDEESASAAGADIDAEKLDNSLLPACDASA
jgi:hypothetical protein